VSSSASTLPAEESDIDLLARNLDGLIAGLRSEIGAIGEDLTRLGHRLPVACPAIIDVKNRLMAMSAHVRSLETTVAARRLVGKEEPKKLQQRAEDMELPLTSGVGGGSSRGVEKACFWVKGPDTLKREQRTHMLESLHRAGDRTLDPEEDES